MKYIALDVETTGLDPKTCQLLQVSMILEDTKVQKPLGQLDHLTCFIRHPLYMGEAYALRMNGWIFDVLTSRATPQYQIFTLGEFVVEANKFINFGFGVDEKATLAGKNVATFDLPFLPAELKPRFRHRFLDPGSMFVDFSTDEVLPDLQACKTRAGIASPVKHDAYYDAQDVISLIRTKVKG